jgi:crossover junction endodeoxyribonuclease RuvC
MTIHRARVLAIDPGTRLMGVALIENRKIRYHGVAMIKQHGSPHGTLKEARQTFLRLLEDLKPEILVLEKAFFANNRSASLLNVFVDEMRSIARRRGLPVISFAPSTVKKFICGHGRASKAEVATVIVARYPELRIYMAQDRVWKEKYHQNMFDAVALGITAITLRPEPDAPLTRR